MHPKEKLAEPKVDTLPSGQKIADLVWGFAPTQAAAAAVELDLFSLIAQGMSGASELAKASGTQARGLTMLLDALVGMGLLDKQKGRYALTPEAEAYLVKGKDSYMGWFFQHSSDMMQGWGRLPEILRAGKPVRPVDGQGASEEFFPPLVRALHVSHLPAARNLARKLGVGARWRGLKILDVAAGSGVWSIAALEEDPSATATALDWPRVLDVAREFAAKHGVDDRFSTLEGSWRETPLEENTYDLALLGHICHAEGEEASREFLRRLCPALRPGGKAVVLDMVPNDERTAPAFPLLFALNMLVHTERGGTYTLEEYGRWFSEAGFKKVEAVDIRSHSPAIVASK